MIQINNSLPPTSVGDAIKNGFKNYSNYEGRIRRSECWFFALFNFIIIFILFFSSISVLHSYYYRPYVFIAYLDIIYVLVMTIPISSSIFRRLHDIGKSGYNIFVLIVPITGFIVLLIHLCTDSEQKENEYGPCQKYILGNNLLINTNNAQPIQGQNGYSIQLNLVPGQNNIPQQNGYIQPNQVQSQNGVLPQNNAPLIHQQNLQ